MKPSAREDDLSAGYEADTSSSEGTKEIDLDDFDDLESNGTQASMCASFFMSRVRKQKLLQHPHPWRCSCTDCET